jgi:hypothetical protein
LKSIPFQPLSSSRNVEQLIWLKKNIFSAKVGLDKIRGLLFFIYLIFWQVKNHKIGSWYKVFFSFQAKASDSNMIVSPFSISAVVAMALAGAKSNTAEQIRQGLSLPADEHLLQGEERRVLKLGFQKEALN